MITLTEKLKKEWITALRSGEYKQRTGRLQGRLRDGIGYCCLGVLKKIAGLRSKSIFLLSDKDMTSSSIEGLKLSQQEVLSSMNDCDNATFGDIADFIEKNVDYQI